MSLLLGSLAAVASVAAAISGCSEDAPTTPSTPPAAAASPARAEPAAESNEARARLDALHELFAKNLSPRDASHFLRAPSGSVSPVARAPIHVELPAHADEPVRLTDAHSTITIAFSLKEASPAPLTVARGLALYRSAVMDGADLIHRVDADGTEDLVVFERAPEEPSLHYRVDLTRVAGLRLVQNTLEMLDARGVPRLRVAPPYVVDAAGKRRSAKLAVEGCAFDQDPRVPFGRNVTPPGAERCVVAVRWSTNDLRYPILVDPTWEATGKLVQPRTRAAVAPVELPASPGSRALLVTGGVGGGGALDTAEVYFPLERSFAIVGVPMTSERSEHTATNLADDGSGKVAIVGGADMAGVPLKSIDVYDPALGTFSSAPAMKWFRKGHTATLLEGGKLLIAGGTASTNPVLITPQSTKIAEIFNPASGMTVELASQMTSARTVHAALRLASGEVLLTGGFGTADFALTTIERFDPVTQQFVFPNPQMNVSRARHTATRLDNGKVLLAGGINATKSPATVRQTAEIYDPGTGTFEAPVTMPAPFAGHTATLLTTGAVLFAGGFDGTDPAAPNYLATVYLFDPAAKTFTQTVDMASARGDHVAARLLAGGSVAAGQGVLVVGGAGTGQTILDTAEILVNLLGDTCRRDDECLSGHCASKDKGGSGVCCNETCDAVCHSCRLVEKIDPNPGICSHAVAGTDLGWSCVDEGKDIPIEFRLKCDGKGNPVPSDGNSCGPNGCDKDGGQCSSECPCSDAGYCTDAAADAAEDADDAAPASGERCELRKPNGLLCDPGFGGKDCQSGNCRNGYCCNTACDGQCEACNVNGFEGTCTPAGFLGDAPPVDPLKPCDGQGGSQCKGYCDNDDRMECTYPNGTVDFTECACPSSGCEQTNHVCDGKGGSTEDVHLCNGLLCGGDACKPECGGDKDCEEDFFCEDKQCKMLPLEGRCDGDHKIRIPKFGKNPDGTDEDCGEILCEPATSICKPQCVSVRDCVGDRVCSLDGKCITPPDAPPPSCACSVLPVPRSASWSLVFLAALFGLANLRARSRRVRPSIS